MLLLLLLLTGQVTSHLNYSVLLQEMETQTQRRVWKRITKTVSGLLAGTLSSHW